MVPLTWAEGDFFAHARARYPVLADREFEILRGVRGSRFEEVPVLTAMNLRGPNPVKSLVVKLWIRPLEPIVHMPMDTPTVLATTRLMPAPATETTAMVPEVHTEQGFRITRVAVPIDAAVVLPANGPDQPDTLTDVIVEDAMLPPSPLRDLSPVRALGPEVTPTLLRQSPVVESPTESVETEPDLSLRLDDTDDADGDSVMADLATLQRTVTQTAVPLAVKRRNVLDTVLNFYRDSPDLSLRLRVEFEEERGHDLGGLTKDLFSAFWAEALETYFKGENSSVPYLPSSNRHLARDIFVPIGRCLEHMLRLTGTLPPQLCRSSILAMAGDQEVDEALLLEDYLLHLPEAESNLLKQCLDTASWTEAHERPLLLFSTVHQLSCIARPENLRRSLINLAQVELLDSSATLLRMMYSGFSAAGKRFLGSLTPAGIRSLFASFDATPEKVASLIEDEFQNGDLQILEAPMVNYLASFVREMDKTMLHKFLVWATGSPTMPSVFKLTFNAASGAARRPIAHTCGNVLELSTDYTRYEEFKREFTNVLTSEFAMDMSLI